MVVAICLLVPPPFQVYSQSNPFDASPGANTYFGGFGSFNWVNSWSGFLPTAGTQLFASANGNSFAYPNIGMTKVLGGSMANQTYSVSLNIGYYYASPIVYTHFNQLYIGSGNGTMNWVATPSPSTMNVWYNWVGYFTPAPVDVGQPFNFHMNMTLAAMHSFVMDLNINFAVLMDLGQLGVMLEDEDAWVHWDRNNALEQPYVVERSEDGKAFHAVGQTEGDDFWDRQVTYLNSKTLFYRLSQTSTDGERFESEVTRLDLPNRNTALLSASFDADFSYLLIKWQHSSTTAEIRISDIQGHLIWQGFYDEPTFECNLPAGIVGRGLRFVTLVSGSEMQTVKIISQ
jgi:hypothetical protein